MEEGAAMTKGGRCAGKAVGVGLGYSRRWMYMGSGEGEMGPQ